MNTGQVNMAKTDNHSWFWLAISLVIGISLGLQVWVAFFRTQPSDVLERLDVVGSTAAAEVLAEMREMESRLRQEISNQTEDRFTGEQAKEFAETNNLLWPNKGVQ